MTALEITTDPITGTDPHLDAAPLVRWEPCAVFADADGLACAVCGWLADDHPSDDDEPAAEAIVVALPTRMVLRRAS